MALIAETDPFAIQLRDEVWADPQPDGPREVYADYLLQQQDPLGEFISLQLARARLGEGVQPREQALLEPHGRRAAKPIELFLNTFTLDRGFVAAGTPRASMTPEIAAHRAWSTLEEFTLASWPHPLLDNPYLRARLLRATDEDYVAVSTHPRPLPFTALAGGERAGFSPADSMIEAFERDDVYAAVRTLELDGAYVEAHLQGPRPLFETRMIAQLDQLRLMFTRFVRAEELKVWKDRFLSTQLPRFGVSFPLAVRGTYVHLEIDRASDLVIEVEREVERSHVDDLLLAARALGEGRRVTLRDLRHPSEVATRQQKLIKGLGRWFPDVVTRTRGPRR